MFVITFIQDVLVSAMSMLNSASPWILFSFAIAGVIHEFVGTDMMKKSALGSTKLSGLLPMTLTGMCLPICSYGTIPLGINMYHSGAYLGPVLTFMTSSPMINPIAIILSLGLLGPQITLIYVLMGFFCPMLIGVIANKLGGEELYYKPAYEKKRIQLNLNKVKRPVSQRIKSGLRWSFTELDMAISRYTVSGMLIALYTDDTGTLQETPPIPAPRENQHIRFFNMDKLSEIETLITGEKNGQVGYAIYRIMHGEMINLFGEGMEDCC